MTTANTAPAQKIGWKQKADDMFVVSMPSRPRIVFEMIFLVALIFGGSATMSSPIIAAIIVGLELVFAMVIARPWSTAHGGVTSRALAALVVVLAVIAPALVERPSFVAERHLGIGIGIGTHDPADPPEVNESGVVLVTSVGTKVPAEGVIHVGDRIVALDRKSLSKTDASSDLTTRTHGDDLPEDTTVSVVRDHTLLVLPVHVPKVHRDAQRGFGRTITAIREASQGHLVVFAATRGALIIFFLLVVLRADGQSIHTLGIMRVGAFREVIASTWITFGAFAVTFIVAIPIGLIGMAAGILERESAQRTETLTAIAQQGSILEFALAAIVAAAFEEIAFRGFLTPRARVLVRSWPLAVILVSIIFGLGHIYEGMLATVQTAFLGAYFAAMMLVRRRLIGPALAHAAFNTIMLIFVRIVTSTHVLERLQEMQHHVK